MNMPTTTETSVTFSLAEIARLEQQRVREDEVRRDRAREAEARAQRDHEAERQRVEDARAAADLALRTRREREETEENARRDARARAAIEVARAEAAAKAQLLEQNALRAHELAVLRARAEASHRWLPYALGGLLALTVVVGAILVYNETEHASRLRRDAEDLRQQRSTVQNMEQRTLSAMLAALDRRYAALRSSPSILRHGGETWASADLARSAVDETRLDPSRILAFADALDGAQARLESLTRLSTLDRREADLAAWATHQRQGNVADARLAASRAKADPGDAAALQRYELALDQLHDQLVASATAGRRRSDPAPSSSIRGTCQTGDPMCGLDGHPL